MKEITRKALVIAVIAGILVILDSLIATSVNQDASFTWIAFVSWTVFFSSTLEDRLKAVIGYIIGFLSAVAIMKLSELFHFMPTVLDIAIGSVLATMIINFLCIELENVQKNFPISVSGIFVGIAMTFSGVGIGLTVETFANALLMLFIIVVYGVLGLLSGWITMKYGIKQKRED